MAEQIAVLIAVTQGIFDDFSLEKIKLVEKAVRKVVIEQLPDVCQKIEAGEKLSTGDLEEIRYTVSKALSLEFLNTNH